MEKDRGHLCVPFTPSVCGFSRRLQVWRQLCRGGFMELSHSRVGFNQGYLRAHLTMHLTPVCLSLLPSSLQATCADLSTLHFNDANGVASAVGPALSWGREPAVALEGLLLTPHTPPSCFSLVPSHCMVLALQHSGPRSMSLVTVLVPVQTDLYVA